MKVRAQHSTTVKIIISLAISLILSIGMALGDVTKTVGTGSDYTTLKAAFDAINAGNITGAITLQITSSITDSNTASLNASGSGSASYTSVIIYPTGIGGYTLSGSVNAPQIDLNGADHVTIDGRLNATGSTIDLTITNTNTGASASTIRFYGSAENNTIKYCTIKGSETSASKGIIFFDGASAGNGNDGNTIDHNDITSDAAGRPVNAVFSQGASGFDNNGVIISNNNIYDVLNKGTSSYMINFEGYTTACTLSGNSLYETASFAPTADVEYNAIRINNTSNGLNNIVTGNYIGGSSASCGGTAWTKTNAYNNKFYAIFINGSNGTAGNENSVQNNTIKNFVWSNSGAADWAGIYIAAGSVNIGNTTANTIGAANGTITVTGGATSTNVYGIYNSSTGTFNCQNNTIGSIIVANAVATLASNFYGINRTSSAVTTISNNTIGGTGNGIQTGSLSTSDAQSLIGINNTGGGTLTISNNTIANLTNGTTNTNTGTVGLINGIASGIGTITNNTIHDLTNANANTSADFRASVCGIALTNTGTGKTVTGNTIYNLSNTYPSFAGSVIGLSISNNTGTSAISGNFIHSLSVNAASASASLCGISINQVGSATYSNNIINLGGSTATTIYGIYDGGSSSQACNINFNTVYIGGSLSTGISNKSYCLYGASTGNTRNYSDNIFMNARSTAGGASLHYAAYFNYAVNTALTLNYNDYHASGTGGVLGYYNSTDVNSLPLIATMDANSLNVNPAFASAGGTTAANYIPSVYTLAGLTISTVPTDYASVNRAGTPTMGAYEVKLNLNIDVYIANVFQASYTTLKNVFDKINIGTHTGAIEIRVKASTTETASAVIFQSGYTSSGGTSNYSSINIYPVNSGLTIVGNLNASLIDLNGADNITIDGRVGATGSTKDLVLDNNSTGSSANMVRFFNSAENNTIKYCTLKGSGAYSAIGVIYFSTSSSGNGNNGNTITNNNITNSGSNRPYNAIYSYGTSGRENSNITISNNNIYDVFNPNVSTSDIQISGYSNSWNVSGNSLYETTTIAPTGAFTYEPMRVNTSTNHLISGNYIGGSAPQCAGTPLTVNANTIHYFCGIWVNGGSGNPCIVQNNIISNINYTSVQNNPWDGIFVYSGDVNVIGNTIGATTGNNSITITTPLPAATTTLNGGGISTTITIVGGGSGYTTTTPAITFSPPPTGGTMPTATAVMSGGGVSSITVNTPGSGYTSAPNVIFDGQSNNYSTSHGIINNSVGTVLISNNNFGSITTVASNYYTHGFETTYNRGATGTTTYSNNLIGSLTTTNSINISSPGNIALQKQDFYGFYNASGGTVIVTGNTIENVTNAYTGANTGSRCRPIASIAGSATIQNNNIKNITCSSSQNGTITNAALIGITISSTSDGTTQTVSGNTISNLINLSSSAAVNLYGIYYSGANSGTNNISGNFIHSISLSSSSTSSEIDGIYLYNGLTTTSNNIVNLGVGITAGYKINGIFDASGATNNNNVYFNSVYIGGTASGVTSNTAAFNNNANTSTRNYRNNIFYNARTGGSTGLHYAIILSGVANTTIDYNDYFIAGSVLGKIGTLDKTSLVLWKAGTSQDVNSLSINPGFTSAGGTSALNYYTSASLPGVSGTGITKDYASLTRGATPKMGALEVNNFIWQGGTSTDFSTALNWSGGVVPPGGADIFFAATPANNCVLDQNRTLGNITNAQSIYKIVVNGKQLTVNDTLKFSGGAQIDATATSSVIIFAGTNAQNIPSGAFVSNTIDGLTINNSSGLTLYNDFTINNGLTLTNGAINIGAHTLTLNGAITKTSGSLIGGSSTNISIGGSGASTTLPAVTLNNLTLNRANGISLGGAVSVGGSLILTTGTLTLGANTLTFSGSSLTITTGAIDASNASATLAFTNTAAITLPPAVFSAAVNNLIINGNGGITASSDFTLNGILNLQSANPSATKGLLDLSTYNLNMGVSATTTGAGDVTGTIKRQHTFSNGVQYSFGNQYTTIDFLGTSGGTKPGWISCKVTIGTAPAWRSGSIKRYYTFISDISASDKVITNMHFLPGEINGNTTANLVLWDDNGTPTPNHEEEHGKTNIDATNYWIGLSGLSIHYLAPYTVMSWNNDYKQWTFSNTEATKNTWLGIDAENPTKWDVVSNWSAGHAPYPTDDVLIPAGKPAYPSLTLSPEIKSIEIEPGASVTVNSNNITINGYTGAWINNGTFYPGTGTVIFSNGTGTNIVSISGTGTNNFNNITVNSNTYVQILSGVLIGVAGTVTNSGIFDCGTTNNTVNYNGAIQSVVNPNAATPGYYNLILSGTGTKTLPVTALSVAGDFTTSGTATATAGAAMTLGGDIIIGEGSAFATGTFDHSIGGNFENNGTFTATAGTTITMNGVTAQWIGGTSSSTTFANLTINGAGGITGISNFTVDGVLNLPNTNASDIKGCLDMGANTLIMGANALNTGIGDVTGIVKRTNIIAGVTYTFGNQFTSAYFPDSGTLPTQISAKISIGVVPSWKTGAIKREIEIIQTGATHTNPTKAVFNLHYLDSELNGNVEGNLVFWIQYNNTEYGRSAINTTDNYVTLSNIDMAYYPQVWDAGTFNATLAELSNASTLTWNGSTSTSWTTVTNWTPNAGPSSVTNIIIPDAALTPNDPNLPSGTEIKTLTINTGGVLNSDAGAQLTINGGSSAWNNVGGTFNPSTSNVIFTGADAIITGATNFYNVSTTATKVLWLTTGSIIRIAGTMSNSGTWQTVIGGPTTVEYNGTDQTVVEPGGGTPGYYNLILSGSGTKTTTGVTVNGILSMEGTATTGAAPTYGSGASLQYNTATARNAGIEWPGTFTGSGGVIIAGTGKITMTGAKILSGTTPLTISSGAALIIDAGGALTVGGALTNNAGSGGLTIISTDEHSGSLMVDGATSGNVIYKRFMTGASTTWHLISSPVPGQSVSGFIFANNNIATNGSKYGLAPYSESAHAWQHFTTSSNSGNLDAGKGYEILITDNPGGTVTFTGTLSSLSPTTAVTSTNASDPGWNLVGNPYTSFIKMNNNATPVYDDPSDNFLTLNTSSLDVSRVAIYIWDPLLNTANYIAINHSSAALSMAPGQGFFINAKAGASTVSYPAAMRTHTQTGIFKSGGAPWPEIELTAETAGSKYKTWVRYIPEMTKGLDPGYDAGTFTGASSGFSVYTRLVEDNGVDFAIQCLPDNDYESLVIPVGLNAAQGSMVIFRVNATGLPSDKEVYLEDRASGTFTRLDEPGSSYPVTLTAESKGTGRFYLHTRQGSTGIEGDPAGQFRVIPIPCEQKIHIFGSIGSATATASATATLYDLNGRVISSDALRNPDENEIRVKQIADGIYLLRIRSGSSSFSRKISWIR